MHITKVPNSYDDYKVEVSWSELKAVEAALSTHHAGVIADETFARMQFYMARIPGPGEEKGKGDDDTLEQTRAKEALSMAGDTKPGELEPGAAGAGNIEPEDIPMPGGGENKPFPGGGGEGGEELEPEPERAAKKPGREIDLESIPFPKGSFPRRRMLLR